MHKHPKLRGEAAEAAFLHKAVQLGLVVACPWGDSAPFDLIVLGGRKLSRVQVKSATRIGSGTTAYVIVAQHNRHSRRRPYTAREIDFLSPTSNPKTPSTSSRPASSAAARSSRSSLPRAKTNAASAPIATAGTSSSTRPPPPAASPSTPARP